jgi:hypothetical protein
MAFEEVPVERDIPALVKHETVDGKACSEPDGRTPGWLPKDEQQVASVAPFA